MGKRNIPRAPPHLRPQLQRPLEGRDGRVVLAAQVVQHAQRHVELGVGGGLSRG